jgi:hypothetical protein
VLKSIFGPKRDEMPKIKSEISGSHGGAYEDDSLLGIAPCSFVEVDRRFRGAYCLYCQGDDRGYQHNEPIYNLYS